MPTALICGGRDYDDRDSLFIQLDRIDGKRHIHIVVQGGAPGADKLAAEWARFRGREVITHPADWKRHGKAAGPMRNQRMLDAEKPDFVVAFPGGSGTADMKRRAKEAGVEVIEII